MEQAHTHGHAHDHLSHGGGPIRVVLVSSLGLALVAALELSVAIFSGSAGVLADGLHNLGDVFTTVALAVAFAFSRRAPSHRFPYGYHRGEDLAGLLVLVLIVAGAVASGVTSIEHLIHRQNLQHPQLALLAALGGFVGNELVALYKLAAGKRLHSLSLIADGKHSRVDGLASLAAAAGVTAAALGFPIVDPLAGLVITALIAQVAWATGRSISARLLDVSDASLLQAVTAIAAKTPGVVGVSQVRARWTGRRVQVELALELPRGDTLERAHAVGEEVRHQLFHEIETLEEAIIHFDPAGDSAAHASTEHHQHGGEHHHH